MSEDKDKLNTEGKDAAWWKPVMIFYAKTAGWIMIPLVISILLGGYVKQSTESQMLFFVSIMAGFAITCYGIYREIKEYKRGLDEKR